MHKIKILVDAHVFDDAFQGTRTVLKGLYSELIKKDNFIFYFAARNIDNLKKEFGGSNNIIYLQLKSGSKYSRLIFEIPWLIKKHNIEIAHFQYIIPLIKNCRFITTIHDVLFLDYPEYFSKLYCWKNKILFKYASSNSDIVTTVSTYSRNSMIKHFNLTNEKVKLVPNGVEITDDITSNIKFEEFLKNHALKDYVLFVSRFENRKNHVLLLESFLALELWKKNIKLVFIGKRIKIQKLDELMEKLPTYVRTNILFFENIETPLLHFIVKRALVFIYPSIAEGFGLPPLESSLLGTRTLCSNTTALSEFDFYKEYLFNPFDVEDLSKKIEFILHDRRFESKNKLIKLEISRRYDWRRSAEIFSHIIESCI
ncbi:MAG: group 1 glycosyl transferase [Ignavibacteria bacterium]|nr:MAG: group 1 glycosyl transferase [Ignavibacteria bacterium]KAF0158551.1 MAG: group 1 glycosyl transferase [Ignavibacteria bacterium]